MEKMENKISIDENLLKNIINAEAAKTVGIIMKRYEIIEDKEILKKEIKEILYEAYRNLRDLLIACSKAKESIHLTKGKEGDKNGAD
jgi:hypothetical protein